MCYGISQRKRPFYLLFTYASQRNADIGLNKLTAEIIKPVSYPYFGLCEPSNLPSLITTSPILKRALNNHPKAYVREQASAILQIQQCKLGSHVPKEGLLRKRRENTLCDWVHRFEHLCMAGLLIEAGRERKAAHSPLSPNSHEWPLINSTDYSGPATHPYPVVSATDSDRLLTHSGRTYPTRVIGHSRSTRHHPPT